MAQALCVQNLPRLRQLQLHVLTELIRAEPEWIRPSTRTQYIRVNPGERRLRLNPKPVAAPRAIFQIPGNGPRRAAPFESRPIRGLHTPQEISGCKHAHLRGTE